MDSQLLFIKEVLTWGKLRRTGNNGHRKNDPRADGCIKLSGQQRYRVRQGMYRIIYEIQETELIIMVVKVAHRSVVYKNS